MIANKAIRDALATYDQVVDFISHTQMISKTFLNPQRALSEIYQPADYQQLTDDLNVEFKTKLKLPQVQKAKTLEDLTMLILNA